MLNLDHNFKNFYRHFHAGTNRAKKTEQKDPTCYFAIKGDDIIVYF